MKPEIALRFEPLCRVTWVDEMKDCEAEGISEQLMAVLFGWADPLEL